MENLESESLDAKLVRLNKEYDDLEERQQDKGVELRALRERSKTGEDVSSQIDTLREEIQEIDSELDGAYKRIRKVENDIREQARQNIEQKTEQSNEQLETEEGLEDGESKLSPEDEKFINAKMTEAQKEFSDEIKRTLNFVYERNNAKLDKLFSDESFEMLDKAKSILKDDNFNIENSTKALEIIKQAFENPVPSNGSVNERTESLDEFVSKCTALTESLEKYRDTILSLDDKNPELRKLIIKIVEAREAVAKKKTRAKLSRVYMS